MEWHEIEREITEHAAELDRLGVLLEQGPLGPDLRSELTLLARRSSTCTTGRCR